MKNVLKFYSKLISIILISVLFIVVQCCNEAPKEVKKETTAQSETHEYFNLRPETEKNYGYSHAVRIGDDLLISGAVSMDDAGNPTAVGIWHNK